MEGVGKKWVQRLAEDEVVKSPVDLFTLEKTALLRYGGMGDKSAAKFIAAIAKAKGEAPLWRLIAGLGIRHVGEQTARTLAANFEDLEAIGKVTREELQDLEDVGPIVAESLFGFSRVKKPVSLSSDSRRPTSGLRAVREALLRLVICRLPGKCSFYGQFAGYDA